ncbi:lysophospholipid acyltransferase family protein [Pelagibacteraceae bacterium]|nr:lysophospholipid acyltransferase family protein [Pelagibacteraceae bacterium]
MQKFLAYVGYIYILFVCITSKIKIKNDQLSKKMLIDKKPFILAFWHSQLMMVGFVWKSKNTLNMLASSHSDGRFGSYIAGHFNLKNISIMAKNKSPSLRKVFKILNEKNYIGITPDGPRGPNKKVSEGIIKIAMHSQVPIIPLGFASNKNFKLNSWDSFLITYPFSKCNFVWGEPITIPSSTKENEIEKYKIFLENKINSCVSIAQSELNA